MDAYLEQKFPQITKGAGYELTSPETPLYNCIAWSVGDMSKWWWPEGQGYWPDGISRTLSAVSFKEMYESFGFSECDNSNLERGHEKIALYADNNNNPTHAARQLSNGQWTSKLGRYKDISHELDGIVNAEYGAPCLVMKRKVA